MHIYRVELLDQVEGLMAVCFSAKREALAWKREHGGGEITRLSFRLTKRTVLGILNEGGWVERIEVVDPA